MPTRSTKIFVPQEAELDAVIDKILSTPAKNIVLSIPKFSRIGSAVNNFHILKQEAEGNGKEVTVESVDERILEMASAGAIKASNPIFRINRRPVSDIIPSVGDIKPPRREPNYEPEETPDGNNKDKLDKMLEEDEKGAPDEDAENFTDTETGETIYHIQKTFPWKTFAVLSLVITVFGFSGTPL